MATIIEDGAAYACFSMRGGGLLLREKTTGRELFIQPGDDAAEFRKTLDALDEIPDDKRSTIFTMIVSEYFA